MPDVTWREMGAFDGVDLEDTFVLGWSLNVEAGWFGFDVEASLWPGHPAYEPPRPNEWTCYERAVLAFEGVLELHGLPDAADVRTTTDADGSRDYGTFDALWRDDEGRWHVAGDSGEVVVRCDRVGLRIVTA